VEARVVVDQEYALAENLCRGEKTGPPVEEGVPVVRAGEDEIGPGPGRRDSLGRAVGLEQGNDRDTPRGLTELADPSGVPGSRSPSTHSDQLHAGERA
jgi:hypothetical protein